jgi:hypothetical protein
MELDDKGLGFPLRFGPDRGLDAVSVQESFRAMLEQILFTMPGERVNRPTFGVGVPRYVFEPNSPLLANRIRIALEENLYNYLGKRVRVLNVAVDQEEAALRVRVSFEIVGTVSGTQELEVFVPTEGAP